MLQGIAFVPRTCQTTLGKTTIAQHDPIIATAKGMLSGYVSEIREFLYEAAKDLAPEFVLPEPGRLMQYGQRFLEKDIVQLQYGRDGPVSITDDVGPGRPLLFGEVYFRILGFSSEQPPAADEASSRAQQSWRCSLEPLLASESQLNASKSQLNVILGGQDQLLLKAKTKKDLTAAQIQNAMPARLAWLTAKAQVGRLAAHPEASYLPSFKDQLVAPEGRPHQSILCLAGSRWLSGLSIGLGLSFILTLL